MQDDEVERIWVVVFAKYEWMVVEIDDIIIIVYDAPLLLVEVDEVVDIIIVADENDEID